MSQERETLHPILHSHTWSPHVRRPAIHELSQERARHPRQDPERRNSTALHIDFLAKTLGFSSSSDRGIIKVLKQLGFLSQDGTPTAAYNQYRSQGAASVALAEGLRTGWKPLFMANEAIHELPAIEQTDTVKHVTGKGEAVAKKMATTFRALVARAYWSEATPQPPTTEPSGRESADPTDATPTGDESAPPSPSATLSGMSLHHDIHIHLPPSADVAVYTAIFRALREELRD